MKPFLSDYWKARESWPLDSREWVLFGRALDQLGPLIAPGWEGDEFGPLAGQELPPWPLEQADRLFLSRALMVLFESDPTDPHAKALSAELTLTKAPPPPTLASSRTWTPPVVATFPYLPLPPIKDAYEKARALNRPREDQLAAWAPRAAAVKRRIAQACLFEELVTGYRLDADGQMRTISANWWNTEDTDNRFRTGKIDRLNPLVPPKSYASPANFAYLYVTRASLDAFAAHLAPAGPVATAATEATAKRQLFGLCEAYFERGEGSIPVGAVWREWAQDEFGLGVTAAKRVWGLAVAKHPKLGARAGKPKRPSVAR